MSLWFFLCSFNCFLSVETIVYISHKGKHGRKTSYLNHLAFLNWNTFLSLLSKFTIMITTLRGLKTARKLATLIRRLVQETHNQDFAVVYKMDGHFSFGSNHPNRYRCFLRYVIILWPNKKEIPFMFFLSKFYVNMRLGICE